MLINMGRRNVMHKPLHSGLLIALVSFVVGIVVVLMLLGNGFKTGLIRATEPFDLLVGAKGSPNQLVLNTVFLQDKPIGNISYNIVKELNADTKLVERAIPLAFGDNYRGFRIVGTEKSIFDHSPKIKGVEWFKLAQGKVFEHNYEAVIGSEVSVRTGLKIGDTFKSVHGVVEVKGTHAHEHLYTVVGVLKPVNGPYDQSIIVSIASVWADHGITHEHSIVGKVEEHAEKEHEAEHVEHQHGELIHHEHDAQTTVIMVKPKGYSEAMQLYQKFQKEERAQMIFPAQVIVQLFSMLGQGQEVLTMLSYAVIVMMLLTLALTMYWVGLNRVREQAVLRALGATRKDLFMIMFYETAFLLTSGAIAGWLIGESIYLWMVSSLQAKTAITMDVALYSMSILAVVGIVIMGLIFATIPAWLTYKKDLAAHL